MGVVPFYPSFDFKNNSNGKKTVPFYPGSNLGDAPVLLLLFFVFVFFFCQTGEGGRIQKKNHGICDVGVVFNCFYYYFFLV